MEMDVRQSKHRTLNPDTLEQSSHGMLAKQDVDIPSNDKPRSRLRMFAILTALFVCFKPHSNPTMATAKFFFSFPFLWQR